MVRHQVVAGMGVGVEDAELEDLPPQHAEVLDRDPVLELLVDARREDVVQRVALERAASSARGATRTPDTAPGSRPRDRRRRARGSARGSPPRSRSRAPRAGAPRARASTSLASIFWPMTSRPMRDERSASSARMFFRSWTTVSSTPGYWIFTTTASPLGSRARCTWPSDAAANASGSNAREELLRRRAELARHLLRESTSYPSAAPTTAPSTAPRAPPGGSRSLRMLSICTSFMKAPLSSVERSTMRIGVPDVGVEQIALGLRLRLEGPLQRLPEVAAADRRREAADLEHAPRAARS